MTNQSQASRLRVVLHYVRSGEPDLTNRQMAIVMSVTWQHGPHTVRALAKSLGISKSVVSKALNTLGRLGFAERVPDENDRRNLWIKPTPAGAAFLERIAP